MDSKTRETTLEEFSRIVRKVNSNVDIILVEGKRDRRALVENGFESRILECSSLPVHEIISRVEESGSRSALVLTDFDAHGRELFREISSALTGHGISLKNIYRKKIKEILDTENMKTTESLRNFRKRIDAYGKGKK